MLSPQPPQKIFLEDTLQDNKVCFPCVSHFAGRLMQEITCILFFALYYPVISLESPGGEVLSNSNPAQQDINLL